MPKRRTDEERVAMARLFSKFENAHEVHRQWKHHFDTIPPDVVTILSVNYKFDKTRAIEDSPRSGLPSSVLSEEKLDEVVINDPRFSIQQGAAQAGISKSTKQRTMDVLNFKPYRSNLIVHLNEANFHRRNEFREIWLNKFENDLIDI